MATRIPPARFKRDVDQVTSSPSFQHVTAKNTADNLENAASDSMARTPSVLLSPTSFAGPVDFRSMTTAPSPPLPIRSSPSASASSSINPTVEVAAASSPLGLSPSSASSVDDNETDRYYQPSPLGGGNSLRVQTNAAAFASPSSRKNSFGGSLSGRPQGIVRKSSASSLRGVSRTPSLKAAIANSIGSAASSTYPSPIISAMGEVTPLPSPLMSNDSPGPWRRLVSGEGRPSSRDGLLPVPSARDSVLVSTAGESISAALANNAKRKVYANLTPSEPDPQATKQEILAQQHARNRSSSEYVPDPRAVPQRHVTITGAHGKKPEVDPLLGPHIHREPHLAESRGIAPTTGSVGKPPTPPPSESDINSQRDSSKEKGEFFEAFGRDDQKLQRWRAVKYLGQGTFSRVVLATSQAHSSKELNFSSEPDGQEGVLTPILDCQIDRKTLVAIKICEHGPRGGASEDRIEMSLKRELDIMQSIRHPSLVNLKAWNIEPTRALLVLSYCPGGDLFDIASTYRHLLTPNLLRRIFAELVGAVRYLHERRIVHRDIKLENVLVNLTPGELVSSSTDWFSCPYSIITLGDLGLSRRIVDDEKLNTRCGSEDYAAPEVILGQPYDGRATDAWSLGVLLYALLEGRLPFDPHPGMSDSYRMRSRTSHRIARVDWQWIKYAGDDGDHDANQSKFEKDNLLGAMQITEGLLRKARNRFGMDQVFEHEWVKGGIQVEGKLKFHDEQEREEVC